MNFTPITKNAFACISEAMPPRIRANARSIIYELLSEAARGDVDIKWYVLHRGYVKYSERQLAAITGVSYQGVRTVLAHLKRCGFLTQKVTHPETVASINEFDSYVDDNLGSNAASNADLTHIQRTYNNNVVKGRGKNNPTPPQEETSSLNKLASVWTDLDPEKKKPPYSLFNRWINSYTPKFPSKSDAEKFIVQAVEHIHHSKTAADFEKTSHLTGFLVKVLENAYDKVEAERPRERKYQTDLIPDGPLGYKRRSDA